MAESCRPVLTLSLLALVGTLAAAVARPRWMPPTPPRLRSARCARRRRGDRAAAPPRRRARRRAVAPPRGRARRRAVAPAARSRPPRGRAAARSRPPPAARAARFVTTSRAFARDRNNFGIYGG